MPGSAADPDPAPGPGPAAGQPAAGDPALGPAPADGPKPAPRPASAAWARLTTPPGWRRLQLRRYAAAWAYLVAFCLAGAVYAVLPGSDQAAVLRWASTNVHNLTHHPVGCLIASAFFAVGGVSVWPVAIAATLFGTNRVLGTWRTVVTCAAGNVVGTLVSEGILGYRIAHGTMPGSDRFIIDIGPSYVIMAAIPVALIWGSWRARAAAGITFLALIFGGQVFSGLASLSVTPVGHATALLTGTTVGSALAWQRRRAAARATLNPSARPR
jgi:hypothetical protein